MATNPTGEDLVKKVTKTILEYKARKGSTNTEYGYAWYNPAIETVGISTVDARVRGGMITLCEFAGNQFDPDKKRQCKHFEKSRQRSCCMYYHDEIDSGACDCTKE